MGFWTDVEKLNDPTHDGTKVLFGIQMRLVWFELYVGFGEGKIIELKFPIFNILKKVVQKIFFFPKSKKNTILQMWLKNLK